MIGRRPIHGRAVRGGPRDRTYNTWASMHQRCGNPKHTDYARYGGRGIAVCARWRTFENFLADMGDRPEGMTLDRENNDAGYDKGNCRWATQQVQARNSSRCVMVTLDGETLPRIEWCARFGISEAVVRRRVNGFGWPIERALRTPAMTRSQGADGKVVWS